METELYKAYKLLKNLKYYYELHYNLMPIGDTEREFFIELKEFMKKHEPSASDHEFQQALKGQN